MKKLALSALLGLIAVLSSPVHALTATGSFNVTVNLYPKCEVTAPGTLALNYVSFQTVDSTNLSAFSVKCTSTLPYTFSLGTASGTLVGLGYTLATFDTAGTTAASGSTGTGAAQNFTVKGTIAQGQGGTCSTGNVATTTTQVASVTGATAGNGTACSATSATPHVLTVTY